MKRREFVKLGALAVAGVAISRALPRSEPAETIIGSDWSSRPDYAVMMIVGIEHRGSRTFIHMSPPMHDGSVRAEFSPAAASGFRIGDKIKMTGIIR